MDFGMPTLLELETLEDNVKLAKELELGFVEINANVPEYQVEAMDPKRLVELTNTYGIGFTLHLDEYLSITDPNRIISEAYIQSVLNSIQFAKGAGIENLTMHFLSGVVFTLPDKKVYVYEKYKDYYYQRLTSFRKRVEEMIGEANLKLCIENTTGFHPFMREAIDFLLESKVFGLTYDCGHNVRYKQVDQDFMISHATKINHMHFHDCIGVRDHIPLGLGELNLRQELRFVEGHAKKVVIEVKTVKGLRESMHFDRTL